MWDFLWHQVQVRTDSVVFNLMDDGEYWNHRPIFYDVSFPFCILCRRRCLLFASMYADRAVVLQYADFHRTHLIWLRRNPIMVTVSMWLFQRGHIQHVQNQLDFGLTRISLWQKLFSYSKDYTKFKFSCSYFRVETFEVWYLERKKYNIWMTMVVIPVHALHYFWVCRLCAYLHMWLQSWKVLWNGMSWPLSACGAVNSTWFGDINVVPSYPQTPVDGVRGYPVGSNPHSNPTRPGDSGKYRLMAHKAIPLMPLLIRF